MFKMNLQLFAHKKGVGSSRNGRDSESKRLRPKARRTVRFVLCGCNILVRQSRYAFPSRVQRWAYGKGHTLFAKVNCVVRFETKHLVK